MIRAGAIFALFLSLHPNVPQASAKSSTCGDVIGKTTQDRDNALAFCAKGIARGAVVAVMAQESILVVKVSRAMSADLQRDSVGTEELVKVWMRGWRITTGRKAVTVTVEFGSVQLAEGTTTILGTDKVSVRRR